jgi:hypothetical protein
MSLSEIFYCCNTTPILESKIDSELFGHISLLMVLRCIADHFGESDRNVAAILDPALHSVFDVAAIGGLDSTAWRGAAQLDKGVDLLFGRDMDASSEQVACIPGQLVPIPDNIEKLKIGRGLALNGDCFLATKCGALRSKRAKKTCQFYVDNRQKRVGVALLQLCRAMTPLSQYEPSLEDQIIGIVLSKHGDHYKLDIGASRPAKLALLGRLSSLGLAILSRFVFMRRPIFRNNRQLSRAPPNETARTSRSVLWCSPE